MSSVVIAVIFVLVGLLNAFPAVGLLGAKQLRSLYGLDFSEPNLLTLMQHRAVMLGLIGIFLIVAAFRRELQPAGFVLGFASMLSFVVFARLQEGPSPWISKVATADIAGSALLLVALVLYWLRA
ncbi:MAG: phosphopantetheine adenylyltransferase [Alphaproteobacteria bacterium HGW-Alphaproteobacteria-11]|nr:MAG: phosphopantetheine adenylyltransferase [Alphaproteobacteria bacterium HGW-Alphaproteobacteria-11]